MVTEDNTVSLSGASSSDSSEEEEGGEDGLSASHLGSSALRETIRVKTSEDQSEGKTVSLPKVLLLCQVFKG
jgi:hypothetical protein